MPPHQFTLINTGFEFEGYGVFYRISYGNTAELQTFLPYHVPKPSFFALVEARKFLKDWKYLASVNLADLSLASTRAFLYRNAEGRLTAALSRAQVDGVRAYRLPEAWRGIAVRDVSASRSIPPRGCPSRRCPSCCRCLPVTPWTSCATTCAT